MNIITVFFNPLMLFGSATNHSGDNKGRRGGREERRKRYEMHITINTP